MLCQTVATPVGSPGWAMLPPVLGNLLHLKAILVDLGALVHRKPAAGSFASFSLVRIAGRRDI